MAEGGDDSRDPIRCGNCLEGEGYLLNPKVIPCSHVFCEECIRGHLEKTDIFTCKICKKEAKFVVEDLPSALTHPTFCDVCERKGKKNMTAKAYCVTCKRKYCGRHEEGHRDLNDHHAVFTIEKYLKSEFAVEQKLCEKHEDERLMVGCSGCWKVYCAECISDVGTCTDGTAHKLLSLMKLSAELKKKMEPQKKIAEEKFTEWTAVMDELTDSVENWDKETEDGLRLIDETENKQISALREKYTKMKADYVKYRNDNKEKITSYMDSDAGVKFTEFHTEMKSLREIITNKHSVDLVDERGSMDTRFDKLVKMDFPTLKLKGQLKLSVAGEHRDIETELTPTDDLVIGGRLTRVERKPPTGEHRDMETELTPTDDMGIDGHLEADVSNSEPPTSLRLMQQVTVSRHCNTVCHYKGYVYVGLNGGAIDRIDEQGKVNASFIKLTEDIVTVRAHNDQLFILMSGKPYKVYVYDLTGNQIRSWDHGDKNTSWRGNKLTFLKEDLIIADVSNKRISVYTTAGDTVRHIPCPAISAGNNTAMCAGGDDCVIVSQKFTARVHKYNLTSGALEWTSGRIANLSCVEYSPPVVLVSKELYSDLTRVWILDYNTGDLLREISDQRTVRSHVFDLCVYGDTLLVPRRHEQSVLYYELRY